MTQAFDPGVLGSLSANPPLTPSDALELAGKIFLGPGNYSIAIQGVMQPTPADPTLRGIIVWTWADIIVPTGTPVPSGMGVTVLPNGTGAHAVGWMPILGRPGQPVSVGPVSFTIPPGPGLPLPGLPVGGNPRLSYAPRTLWAIVTQIGAPGAVVSVSQASSN